MISAVEVRIVILQVFREMYKLRRLSYNYSTTLNVIDLYFIVFVGRINSHDSFIEDNVEVII